MCSWRRVRPPWCRPAAAGPDDDEAFGGQGHLGDQVAGDEDGPALGGQRLHQVPDPADSLRVQAVDRLVEDEDRRVAEQRGRDAEPLGHAQGELACLAVGRPVLASTVEAHGVERFVDPAGRDGVAGGQRLQVRPGAAARVKGFGFEQRADLAERERQVVVGAAGDLDRAVVGRVQAQDQAHGGGFAGPVRPEEAGDDAGADVEAQLIDRRYRAVALGQGVSLDHGSPPLLG